MCQISEYWHLVDTHTFANTYYLHGCLQFSCQMWGCLAVMLPSVWPRGRSRKKVFVSSPVVKGQGKFFVIGIHMLLKRLASDLAVIQKSSSKLLWRSLRWVSYLENTTWRILSCFFFLEGAGNRSGLSKRSGVNALMALKNGPSTHLERVVSARVEES